MAALLVSLVIMSIVATMAMPVWRQAAKREKEAELIFRAGQVAHAIEKMRRKIPNAAAPDLDYLVKQRYLRKKYKDPMTKDGEWRIVTPQELQGVNMSNLPGATTPGGTSRSGSPGFGSQGSGPGGLGSGSGGASTRPGGLSSAGGSSGTSSFGVNSPGSSRPGGSGPVAAVASKSTERSARIFKGRDRYDQWIVTIEDVIPRQFLRQQQQPGQPGRQGPGSSRPGSSSPGSSSPGLGRPSTPSGLPSRP